MKTARLLFVICILASIACAIACLMIDSYVDSGGFLNEPFPFTPIGFMFFFVGLIGLLSLTKKARLLFAICILASIACATTYQMIGSYVDSDGFLHEPFPLIPIGFMFFFVGLIGLLSLTKKARLLFSTCMLASIACAAVYWMIGLSVDSDDFSSFLISASYMFFFVGLIGLLLLVIKHWYFSWETMKQWLSGGSTT